MEQYRTIHDGSEIISLIQQADHKEYGQVWQTQGSVRQTYQIMNLAVDADNGAIILQTQEPFEFNRDFPVYVRISDRNLIFKLKRNYLVKKNRLICTLPTEAKAIELRATERFKIPANKSIQLKLKPLETAAMDVTVRLNNFSHKGFGIYATALDQEFFQRIGNFSVLSIAGIKIGNSKTVQVKHVDKTNVGFALNEPFDKGTFSYLQNFLL